MAIAFVGGDAANGATAVALDSSLANFVVIQAGSWNGSTTAIIEGGGYSNIWKMLPELNSSNHRGRIFYAFLFHKGVGHVFGHNGGAPCIQVALFSGVPADATVLELKQAFSLAPGVVSPTLPGSLIISGVVCQGSVQSAVSGGLTIVDTPIAAGSNVGGSMAYLIQGAAAPVTPAWTGGSGAIAGQTLVINSSGIVPPPARLLAKREQFKNGGVTPLTANIDAAVTSFTVVAGSQFPAKGPFRAKIGSEVTLVQTIAGNVCSDVIRGAENTVPAPHTAGDVVSHIITGMSLSAISLWGAFNRRPSEEMFTPLNLVTSGPTPTAIVSTDEAGVVLNVVGTGSGYNLMGMYQPIIPPPYTVTASFQMTALHKSLVGFGMHWRGMDSKLATFDSIAVTGETNELSSRKANSSLTFSASYMAVRTAGWARWMRLSDDGVNRKCWLSADGQYWIEVHSIARADFVSPQYIGWHVFSENLAAPIIGPICRLLTWEVVP